METQKQFQFPGLVKECQENIKDLHLPDITEDSINKKWTKNSWKKIVKEEIKSKCEKDLKDKLLSYSKLRDGPMKVEGFEARQYMKDMKLGDELLFTVKTEKPQMDVILQLINPHGIDVATSDGLKYLLFVCLTGDRGELLYMR